MEISKDSPQKLAGRKEIEEISNFKYQTSYVRQLLTHDNLIPENKFMMYVLAQTLPKARVFNTIMSQYGGDCSGIEFKQEKAEKFAFVLPDASRLGNWRVSFFDASGFSYHSVFSTAALAAEEMVLMGFTENAQGSLDRLAETKKWALGTAIGDLMMQHNAGKISYVEFCRMATALNDKYALESQGGVDHCVPMQCKSAMSETV